MKIYHLEQRTWNNRMLGDFNLPISKGYFLRLQECQNQMQNLIDARVNDSDEDGWLTEDDFVILTIEVKE